MHPRQAMNVEIMREFFCHPNHDDVDVNASAKKQKKLRYSHSCAVCLSLSLTFSSILYRWFIKFPVCDAEHVCKSRYHDPMSRLCMCFRLFCKIHFVRSRRYVVKFLRAKILCSLFVRFDFALNSSQQFY